MDTRDNHADGSAQADFVDSDEQMDDFADWDDGRHRRGSSPMRTFNRRSASPDEHKPLARYDSDSDAERDSETMGGGEATTTASNQCDGIEMARFPEGPESPIFEPDHTSYGAELDGFHVVQDTTTRINHNGNEMSSLLEEAESPLFEPETTSHGGKLDGTNESRPTTPTMMETQMPESSTKSTMQKEVSTFVRADPMKARLQAKRLRLPLTTHARRGGRARNVEDDPENHMIKDLRVNKSYTWDAIANKLNERRIAEGVPPTCTAASVYSRFVRNAPRIAASKGDRGFNPRDYMHLRQPQNYPPRGRDVGDLVDTSKKRTRADASDKIPRELRGNVRQITASGEDLQSPEKAARFMEAVEMATQQLWMTVRDLMEQFTGHVYDPEDLKKHFETT